VSGRLVVVGRGAPERGGIPSYLAMLVREQERLGRPVVLVNLAPPDGSDGGATSWANLRRTLSDVVRVLRVARRGDIVDVHSALAPTVTALRAGLLLLAARARGAKVVLHAHGGRLAQQLPLGRQRRLTAAAMRPAHVVVAVAEVVRAALLELGVPAGRVRVVTNGVDLEGFDGEPAPHDGPPRVLFVGGLTARKGVLDLAAASDDLHERGVDHELWLAGGIPDDGDAAYAEVMSGLPHDARVLGPQPPEAMPEVYAQCDVFCLPSWWEAMPLTVLEAQAAGLPVVAAAVGDVPRLLVDGETGRLVPPREPEDLADALAALLTDAAVRERMGRKARENARRFDQRDTISALARLFDELGDAP
jgi:glycosyltransferase involved in cell wall biosynthesis